MQINIKTSEANKEIITKLTSKLPTGSAENVIARIALGYSIATGKRFTFQELREYDSKGKEYKDHILFDAINKPFYVSLICQAYSIYKTEGTIPKYIKTHIDHGLELMGKIFDQSPSYSIFDFLGDNLEKGLSALELTEVTLDHVHNTRQSLVKSYFTGALNLEIGTVPGSNESITLPLNNTDKYNNAHIAVAGKSGSGKTQFALALLEQIVEKSNGQVNFVYLDFKGLKEGDKEYYEAFFERTKANLVNAPQQPFPLNPLTFIDNVNEKNKIMGISKFVDIIAKYARLGKRQEQVLNNAIKEVFIDQEAGKYPTLEDINSKLSKTYDKVDTLVEIMERLTELEIFAEPKRKRVNFLNENNYFSLSGDLPDSVRFTSVFLVIYYIYNTFMNMENAPVEDGKQAIRYVLLIDEAHVLFKEKKAQDLLEKILREIRSKGVSVILLSQGIAEFNQPDFDFSSMCEIAFLLDIKDKNAKKDISRFLGGAENDWGNISKQLTELGKFEGITNSIDSKFDKLKLRSYSE